MKSTKLSAFVLLISSTVNAVAQSGGVDADPYNPNNWVVTREAQGTGTGESYWIDEFGAERHDLTSETFSGDSPIGWGSAVSGLYREQTVTASVTGTYRHTITWRGLGPGPNTVLIHVTSRAFGHPSSSLSCGLGNLSFTSDQESGNIESGYAYRSLSVDGGVASTSVTGSASSTVGYVPNHPHYYGGTSVGFDSGASFTQKALAITRAGDQTFRREAGMSSTFPPVRTVNQRTDLGEGFGDVGIPVLSNGTITSNFFGQTSQVFRGEPLGQWTLPGTSFTWNGPNGMIQNPLDYFSTPNWPYELYTLAYVSVTKLGFVDYAHYKADGYAKDFYARTVKSKQFGLAWVNSGQVIMR